MMMSEHTDWLYDCLCVVYGESRKSHGIHLHKNIYLLVDELNS